MIVGGTNTAIDFVILFGLKFLGLTEIPANFISTSIALVFSFFANKKFTFKDNSKNKIQFIKFLVITLIGLWIIQPIIIWGFKSLFESIISQEYITLLAGKLLATCFTLVWNYLLYKKFVYKNKN